MEGDQNRHHQNWWNIHNHKKNEKETRLNIKEREPLLFISSNFVFFTPLDIFQSVHSKYQERKEGCLCFFAQCDDSKKKRAGWPVYFHQLHFFRCSRERSQLGSQLTRGVDGILQQFSWVGGVKGQDERVVMMGRQPALTIRHGWYRNGARFASSQSTVAWIRPYRRSLLVFGGHRHQICEGRGEKIFNKSPNPRAPLPPAATRKSHTSTASGSL